MNPRADSPAPPEGRDAATARLLEVVRELARELHPARQRLAVALDSRLAQDLGLDSLARMELAARLERVFGANLPESVFASAETVRDLLDAIQRAPAAATTAGAIPSRPVPESAGAGEVVPPPADTESLVEVLRWHARRHAARTHLTLLDDEARPAERISYAALLERAEIFAAGLLNHGLGPRETVAIMLPTCAEYFYCFFGTLLAGGVPVPIYPPARASDLEEHSRRYARVLANAEAALLVTADEARAAGRLLRAEVASLRAILRASELGGGTDPTQAAVHFAVPRAHDLAFLQYTSGTTADPKGVMLSHAMLLANIRAMGEAVAVSAEDVFVSWLPLYHDMGLIGAWLGCLYHGVPLYLMSPLAFLHRPRNWLYAIHRYRATMSAGPNFAFELCLHRISDEELAGLDLRSLRLLFNGAEPISPATLRRFTARFAPYGLKPEALTPVYGLAECSLGLAFPPRGRGPRIDRIERETFVRTGRAVPAAAGAGESEVLEFVACGRPLPGHAIRLVDAAGRELGERQEGRLEFRGPSATNGYYRNPEATRRLFDGEWLDSGDLAYLADGEVYLTGRVKDIVIRAGRNIHPQALEEAVGLIPGIRKGCVAVFGSRDPATGTERLVVVAETRARDPSEHERLRAAVTATVTAHLGEPPDEVVIAPPRSILKTSSGKIRRQDTRARYERGEIGRSPRRWWWRRALRLGLRAALGPGLLRHAWRAAAERLYGLYAWSVFVPIALLDWLCVVLSPHPAWALAVTRRLARALVRTGFIPLRVAGQEHLPAVGGWVLVANHASYLDGLIVSAILPGVYHYIAKREFTAQPLAGIFLRRLGAEFVERFDPGRSVLDARRLAALARSGKRLVFFPEGTFGAQPGLRPFHLGAFLAAAEAGVPVIPMAIRGTRAILPYPRWLPRRAPVEVVIGAPIFPQGHGWEAAIRLRDAARAHLLAHCGETDLANA